MNPLLDINKLHLAPSVQKLISSVYKKELFVGTPEDTSVKDMMIYSAGMRAQELGLKNLKIAILGGRRTLENGLTILLGCQNTASISCMINFEVNREKFQTLEWIEQKRRKKMPFPVVHFRGEIADMLTRNNVFKEHLNYFFFDRCGSVNGPEDIEGIVAAVEHAGSTDEPIVFHLTAAMRGIGRSYQDYQTTWGPKLNSRLSKSFKLLHGEGKFEKYKNPGRGVAMLSYQVSLSRQ